MKNILRSSNEYLILLLCILSTWVLAGAIPYLSLDGLYGQVDTQIFFLHSLGAFLFFTQTIRFLLYDKEINKINHPLIIIPLLLAFLGILSAIFSDYTHLVLTGSPQIGQGVFWYLDLAIMIFVFSNILHKKNFRIILLCNLIILTSIATIFTIKPGWQGIPISFFYFNDYLCFFGVLVFIVSTTVTTNKILLGLSFIFLGLYLYLLDNNAAMILWICTFLLGIFLTFLELFKEHNLLKKLKQKLSSNVFFLVNVLVLSFLVVALAFIFWQGDGGASTEIMANPLVSAIVRGKIAEIALAGLMDFKSFFLGAGWGRVNELLLQNMNVWQYDQLTVGFNLHFHTHNELFEHLISLGIFGFILFVIFIYKIFDASNAVSLFTKMGWLLFFLISCFWFLWAGTLPLIAVAIACLVAMERKEKLVSLKVAKNTKYLFCSATFLTGLFISYGSWLTFSYTKEVYKMSYGALSDYVKNQSLGKIVCEGYYNDKRGGFALVHFMNAFPGYVIANRLLSEEQNLKVIEGLQCMAHSMIIKGQAPLDLISATILMDSRLYYSGNEDAKILFNSNKIYEEFKERALLLVKRAPKRGDLVVPYVSLALEKRKFEDAIQICGNKKVKGIENLCYLVTAGYLIDKLHDSPSARDIKKSIEYLSLAKQKGLYTEKVYGWWFSEDTSYISGYNLRNGVPLSADLMYLISDKEMRNIENLIAKLN